MLLSPEHLKQLKKVNVSKDADLTKERVATDFKAATKEEKKEIVELSGQVVNAFYRVFKTGSANARIVLAMAQILKVQPWYYTGELENRDALEEAQLQQFLKTHGYNDLLKGQNAKPVKQKTGRKPRKAAVAAPVKAPPAPVEPASAESAPVAAKPPKAAKTVTPKADATKLVELSFSDAPEMKKAVEGLSEDDAKELLHTLYIRARGGGDAAFLADIVKRCLLK